MSPENSGGRIRSKWGAIIGNIPKEFLEGEGEKVLRSYYFAQLRIGRGGTKRAERILHALDKNPLYNEFEENHQDLLAALDIAARGKTNRDGVKPLF